jgi:RNA polymerase sigma-70 factor (ECF subfamily)
MESLPEEQRWIARFQAGDPAAFEKIMTHYEPYVLGLLWRMTGDRAKAEDLCQESFIRVLKGLPHFRGESSLKTWIFRIAHNTATDLFRSAKREAEPLGGADSSPSSDDGPGPLERIEGEQLRRRLEAAMELLPELPRIILHLFYWDDLAVVQIASVLKIPEGTVKTHLFRGRKALRESVKLLLPGGAS